MSSHRLWGKRNFLRGPDFSRNTLQAERVRNCTSQADIFDATRDDETGMHGRPSLREIADLFPELANPESLPILCMVERTTRVSAA